MAIWSARSMSLIITGLKTSNPYFTRMLILPIIPSVLWRLHGAIAEALFDLDDAILIKGLGCLPNDRKQILWDLYDAV